MLSYVEPRRACRQPAVPFDRFVQAERAFRLLLSRLLLTAPTVHHLPGNIGRSRQPNANGEPVYVKTWPRVWTCLAEPIGAKGLNCARKENDAETCNEQDQSFDETALDVDGMLHRDNQCRPHISQRSLFRAPR
jgi:hypothetical protein